MAWTMTHATADHTDFAMTAGYEWDDQGRMTSLTYPSMSATNPESSWAGTKYSYNYDAMGRMGSMDRAGLYPWTGIATATYGVAGELLTLTHAEMSETRQYNSMYQMTRMTAAAGGTTVMDMQYNYPVGANN